ncbi:MAG: hypothetical protein [Caudoviricetes sp.]|nr:MAG: hypothetical protein [Caudoviricetes sp.]
MRISIDKKGNVTLDFEGDLLVTKHKQIDVESYSKKEVTIRNAYIIGSRLYGMKLPLRKYVIHCIKECYKRYVK